MMPVNKTLPNLHNMEQLALMEDSSQKTLLYRSSGAGIYGAEKFTANPH
jgi:hypothetical protein